MESRSARSRRRTARRARASRAAWKKVKEPGWRWSPAARRRWIKSRRSPGCCGCTSTMPCAPPVGGSRARAATARGRARCGVRRRSLAKYAARIAAESFTVRGPSRLATRHWCVATSMRRPAPRWCELRAAHANDILLGALLQVSPTRSRRAGESRRAREARGGDGRSWFALFAAQQRVRSRSSAAISPERSRCSRLLQSSANEQRCRTAAPRSISAWARPRSMMSLPRPRSKRPHVRASAAASCRSRTMRSLRRRLQQPCAMILRAAVMQSPARTSRSSSTRSYRARSSRSRARPSRRRGSTKIGSPRPAPDSCRSSVCTPLSLHRLLAAIELVDHGDRAAVAALRAANRGAATGATPGSGPARSPRRSPAAGRRTPARGRELLHHAIATTARDPSAIKARAYSFSVLVDDAGRRAAWADVLALLGEERGAAVPERCVSVPPRRTARCSSYAVPMVHWQAPSWPRPWGGSWQGDAHRSARRPTCRVPGRRRARASAVLRQLRAAAGEDRVALSQRDCTACACRGCEARRDREHAGRPGTASAAARTRQSACRRERPGGPERHSRGRDRGDRRRWIHRASRPRAHRCGRRCRRAGSRARCRRWLCARSSAIAATRLRSHPVVAIAACGAAATGHAFQTTWGLADAFRAAGASAVIASPDPIADATAPKFFAGVRARIATGSDPSVAVRDERAGWTDPAQRAWIDRLVVFQ